MSGPFRFPKLNCLSDPYCEWDPQLLSSIVCKPDENLTTEDYSVIFSKNLPAADYLEGRYYLQPYLNHLRNSREIHQSNYADSYLWWIQNFEKKLRGDGIYEYILTEFEAVLNHLLSTFELFDLSESECKKTGRDFNYSIGPYNQHTLHHIMDDLTVWGNYRAIQTRILETLVTSLKISHVRWYIELASHSREWCLIFDPESEDIENFTNKEEVFKYLHQFKYLSPRERLAADITANEKKWKYNHIVGLM